MYVLIALLGLVAVLLIGGALMSGYRALRRRVLRLPPPTFEVSWFGRDELRYIEGDRRMTVYAELLATGDRVLDANSVRQWDHPHDLERIDAAARDRIIANIVEWCGRGGKQAFVTRQGSGRTA